MTPRERVAVAVIGGGPAGASAALELARSGVATVLVERSDGRGWAVGECLAPSATPLLQRLGLDQLVPASGALPSHGNRSSWGGDGSLVERTFLREPFGHGWHLDRPRFNRALLDAVETAGVPVWQSTRITKIERAKDGWQITVASANGERVLHAGLLVDASGRQAVVARRERVRRRSFDSQIAAVGFLAAPGATRPLSDATTMIEATGDGWWYAALVPGQRLVVAWFTDPDLFAARAAWRPANWWALLHATELVGPLVATHGFGRPERIDVRAAGSSLLIRPVGDGWIAAGDAAAAYDPLSSHGIGSALAGGASAAWAVAATLGGDSAAFPRYQERLFADYARYLWTRAAYYADERRWPDSPFWQRRHADVPAGPSSPPVTVSATHASAVLRHEAG